MEFKSKNTFFFRRIFVTILTLFLLLSCKSLNFYNYKIESQRLDVKTDSLNNNNDLSSFISPYKKIIDNDLDSILTYSQTDIDKTIKNNQTTAGHFFIEASNYHYKQLSNSKPDIILFNFGGIRTSLNKGKITKRMLFEIMPFENKLMLVELKGEQVLELAQFIIDDKKAHPISGLQIKINNESKKIEQIYIQNQLVIINKSYTILTSDYLSNGGDNMNFFLKKIKTTDLNSKLRDVLIEYCRKHSTINFSISNSYISKTNE